MTKTRTENAIKNSAVSFFIQLLTILLKFLVQTVIIKYMGKEYLGLNGLFANILSMLSFADLGIGSAITFNLYKPLAEKNSDKVQRLMNLYKKIYFFIGIGVFILGVLVIPFLPSMTKNSSINNVALLFLVYLLNTVISYFYSYKRTLLIADQKEWKSTLNIFIFLMIQTTLQLVTLIFTQNYFVFLTIQVVCTLLSNLVISKFVNKEYSFFSVKTKLLPEKSELELIKRNTLELFGSRIGSVVLTGTDNIVISIFLGLSIVGIYSNYALIVSSVTLLIQKIFYPVISGIGNLLATGNQKEGYNLFKKIYFINLVFILFSSTLMMNVFTPFIQLWAGDSYILDEITLFIIVLNFLLLQFRQTTITFLYGFGIFKNQGIKSTCEAAINLVFSVLFVKYLGLGISGVILGTIVSNLTTSSWFENKQVFNRGFKRKVSPFLAVQYVLMILLSSAVILEYLLIRNITLENQAIEIVLRGSITFVLNFIILMCFYKTKEFKYMQKVFLKIFKRK